METVYVMCRPHSRNPPARQSVSPARPGISRHASFDIEMPHRFSLTSFMLPNHNRMRNLLYNSGSDGQNPAAVAVSATSRKSWLPAARIAIPAPSRSIFILRHTDPRPLSAPEQRRNQLQLPFWAPPCDIE